MADIFHLVGFRPFDRMALRREERREAKHIPGTRRPVRAVAGRPQVSHQGGQAVRACMLARVRADVRQLVGDKTLV